MRGWLHTRWLAGSLALPGLLLWACASTLPGPRLCSERDPCEGGQLCVIGRCRAKGTMPVSLEAARLTFVPVDLAYVRADGVRGPNDVEEALVLGKQGEASELLLRFAVTLPEGSRLQRALLVMDPLPRCGRRPGRVRLELSHITTAWQSSRVSEGRRPTLSLPMHAGDITVTPPSPLRLDVTEVVRAWSDHPKRHHGLALRGLGTSESGACFSSGVSWGRGPRLEIYLWPKEDEGDGGGGHGGAGGGEGGASEGGANGSGGGGGA